MPRSKSTTGDNAGGGAGQASAEICAYEPTRGSGLPEGAFRARQGQKFAKDLE